MAQLPENWRHLYAEQMDPSLIAIAEVLEAMKSDPAESQKDIRATERQLKKLMTARGLKIS